MGSLFESARYWFATALSAAGGVFGLRLEEQPRYEVLLREQRVEVRRYAPYVVAATTNRGTMDGAGNASFSVLAGYIFGNNASSAKIAMTTPVIQKSDGEKIAMTAPVIQKRDGGAWAMEFALPSKYDLTTAPKPTDPRVQVRRAPAETVAALRFSGSYGGERLRRLENELASWIRARKDYVATGEPRLAVYDPPFSIPFLRRNEVLIPVRSTNGAR